MRVPSLLAATGLVATGLIAATPTANAAGACSIYVLTKFSITAPYRAVPVSQGPNCAVAGVVSAAWTGYHPTAGPASVVTFANGARSDTVELYDDVPLGLWNWRPGYAYDANDNAVYQYSPYTDVRLGSYGRVTVARTGTRVNVRTTAMRYWSGGDKFIGWSDARGQIQYRTLGTTTWVGLKDVYSSPTGLYSYTFTSAAARDYRVVLAATPQIWNAVSPTVRG
jgi:hypothetical protein